MNYTKYLFLMSTYLFVALYTTLAVPSEVTLGFLSPMTSGLVNGALFSGALPIAVDHINNRSDILPNTTIKFLYENTDCDATTGLGAAVKLFNKKIDVFVGPGCSAACVIVGRLSTAQKIPMFTYSCSSIELANKKTYPYVSRMKSYARGSKGYTPKAFVALMKYYNWRKVCLIERRHDIYTPLAATTKEEILNNNFIIQIRESYYSEDTTFEMYGEMLDRMADNCRIFFLITRARDVVHFLVHAKRRGLFAQGYVFITVDFKISSLWEEEFFQTWGVRDYDDLSVNYLQGLVYVSSIDLDQTTEEFQKLMNEARERLKLAPFYNTSVLANKTSTNVGFIYDTVMLYAKALHAMLLNDSNATVNNTERLMEYAIAMGKFEGKSGKVKLDPYGDRIPELSISNYHHGHKHFITNFDPDKQQILQDTDFRSPIYFADGTTNVPINEPYCGFQGSKCKAKGEKDYSPLYISIPIVACFAVFAAGYLYKKHHYKMRLLCKGLIINFKEISFGGKNSSIRSKISAMSIQSNLSTYDLFAIGQFFPTGSSRIVIYKSKKVFLKTIRNCKIELNMDVLRSLKQIKDINHTNINAFIGVAVKGPDRLLIWSFCSKGSLQDVLQNDDIECDWMFRLSFAHDIAKGLSEIHRSAVAVHGDLNSSNCLIDNRWVCKLSNFGTSKFKSDVRKQANNTHELCKKKFWKAPELLVNKHLPCTKEGDIYSYGIILSEICTRDDPYRSEMDRYEYGPSDIINMVKSRRNPPFRPTIPCDTDAEPDYIQLMKQCWQDEPSNRGTVKDVLKAISKLNQDNKLNGSLVDHMLNMMEKYTTNLEDIVADRTRQLEEEKNKTETLLYKMLPKSVANKLKEGQPVLAEHFESVTIFFSDIVGFTCLCSDSTPLEVVDMLNDLYSCFDQCIDMFDVYKVETIGDAYMVVSGLPIRNGNKHAGEIATMSLDLLSCVRTFKIRHCPGKQMQLRIGIHSGSCVAGVVGLKMPRYCLFGDTVNYASRMESSGLALRVHVSPECKVILDELGGYHLQQRGPVQMKGKGTVVTYFLSGKDGYTKELPDLSKAAGIEEHNFK